MPQPRPLSADALRVLRQIHARGLNVRQSFHVPNPTYQDGETMTDTDWAIASRELWHSVSQNEWLPAYTTRIITRRIIRANQDVTQVIAVIANGTEVELQSSAAPLGFPLPDQELARTETYAQSPQLYQHYTWQSDYIDRAYVKRSAAAEEFEGHLDRYTLTPAAVALIAT